MPALNETHDPGRRSWVETANEGSDFTIQNLPFGVFRPRDESRKARVGVAIGDQILDVDLTRKLGLLGGVAADAASACRMSSLNALMGLGASHWSALRTALSQLLASGDRRVETTNRALVPMTGAEMLMPATIGDYTDFFCSLHHATNAGSMFLPDNPLTPNYKHMPVAYHGRSSSVVLSGTPVRRPRGQIAPRRRGANVTDEPPGDAAAPSFGPTRLLDYELEVGFFVGPGNDLGSSLSVDEAESRIFGFCLLNDWSARDVQLWESQPLGPFLAKSFQTSISPWVVTAEALAPYRVPAADRPPEDPQPRPYLDSADNRVHGGIDLTLEVHLHSAAMREQDEAPHRLSRGTFRDLYWTPAQMLAHHASNGCNLRPGDLLASGTVSGAEKHSRGCLLELSWRGTEPIELPAGETRTFLQDGDEVILSGHCEKNGAARVGFGECRGIVEPVARGEVAR